MLNCFFFKFLTFFYPKNVFNIIPSLLGHASEVFFFFLASIVKIKLKTLPNNFLFFWISSSNNFPYLTGTNSSKSLNTKQLLISPKQLGCLRRLLMKIVETKYNFHIRGGTQKKFPPPRGCGEVTCIEITLSLKIINNKNKIDW